jgi:hypothetical protein
MRCRLGDGWPDDDVGDVVAYGVHCLCNALTIDCIMTLILV